MKKPRRRKSTTKETTNPEREKSFTLYWARGTPLDSGSDRRGIIPPGFAALYDFVAGKLWPSHEYPTERVLGGKAISDFWKAKAAEGKRNVFTDTANAFAGSCAGLTGLSFDNAKKIVQGTLHTTRPQISDTREGAATDDETEKGAKAQKRREDRAIGYEDEEAVRDFLATQKGRPVCELLAVDEHWDWYRQFLLDVDASVLSNHDKKNLKKRPSAEDIYNAALVCQEPIGEWLHAICGPQSLSVDQKTLKEQFENRPFQKILGIRKRMDEGRRAQMESNWEDFQSGLKSWANVNPYDIDPYHQDTDFRHDQLYIVCEELFLDDESDSELVRILRRIFYDDTPERWLECIFVMPTSPNGVPEEHVRTATIYNAVRLAALLKEFEFIRKQRQIVGDAPRVALKYKAYSISMENWEKELQQKSASVLVCSEVNRTGKERELYIRPHLRHETSSTWVRVDVPENIVEREKLTYNYVPYVDADFKRSLQWNLLFFEHKPSNSASRQSD